MLISQDPLEWTSRVVYWAQIHSPLLVSAQFHVVRYLSLQSPSVHQIVASPLWERPFHLKLPGMPLTSPPLLLGGLWVN